MEAKKKKFFFFFVSISGSDLVLPVASKPAYELAYELRICLRTRACLQAMNLAPIYLQACKLALYIATINPKAAGRHQKIALLLQTHIEAIFYL
jgi:hypothetical protein